MSYMWSFFNKKGLWGKNPLPFLLAPDTIVPYVKYHENVFLLEIIKVQRFNTIFDICANNIVNIATVPYAMKSPPLN